MPHGIQSSAVPFHVCFQAFGQSIRKQQSGITCQQDACGKEKPRHPLKAPLPLSVPGGCGKGEAQAVGAHEGSDFLRLRLQNLMQNLIQEKQRRHGKPGV